MFADYDHQFAFVMDVGGIDREYDRVARILKTAYGLVEDLGGFGSGAIAEVAFVIQPDREDLAGSAGIKQLGSGRGHGGSGFGMVEQAAAQFADLCAIENAVGNIGAGTITNVAGHVIWLLYSNSGFRPDKERADGRGEAQPAEDVAGARIDGWGRGAERDFGQERRAGERGAARAAGDVAVAVAYVEIAFAAGAYDGVAVFDAAQRGHGGGHPRVATEIPGWDQQGGDTQSPVAAAEGDE